MIYDATILNNYLQQNMANSENAYSVIEDNGIMSKTFELVSSYQPSGDQPTAIKQLFDGLDAGLAHQTLLGGECFSWPCYT